MIRFAGQHLLLDVEGTTSAVAFVYDVLFPYAREHLQSFVQNHWHTPELARLRAELPPAGAPPLNQADFISEMYRLMDADAKTTALKELQGLIWQAGFEAGELQGHIFDDVPAAVRRWHQAGVNVSIYSSGSIRAQRLYFSHLAGPTRDLTPLLHRHFDTTVGPKREAASYARLAAQLETTPAEVLFLSDVPAELDAARAAGMQTGLVVRPGNAPVADPAPHPVLRSFAEIEIGQRP